MLEADTYGTAYHPKSRETKLAYRAVLLFVQARLGDMPPELLYGAGEEVLAVLKDEHKRVRALYLRLCSCAVVLDAAGPWFEHGRRARPVLAAARGLCCIWPNGRATAWHVADGSAPLICRPPRISHRRCHPSPVACNQVKTSTSMVAASGQTMNTMCAQVPDKERAVKELLDAEAGDLRDHFHELLAAAERITDYDPDAGAAAAEVEEDEYGVALDLDDDDDDAGPGAQRYFACHKCACVRI